MLSVSLNKKNSSFHVTMQAPRLMPEQELVRALMNIGQKLQQLPTKELRSECLVCGSGVVCRGSGSSLGKLLG